MTTPLAREYFDGYDNDGNLFFDGFNDSNQLRTRRAPEEQHEVPSDYHEQHGRFPGSVQWDGTYLTVTDQGTATMYQYTLSGTKATLKGSVSLKGSSDCAQTWIATGIVFCADAGDYGAEVFNYPAGGSPIAVFSGNFDLPLGTVASKK